MTQKCVFCSGAQFFDQKCISTHKTSIFDNFDHFDQFLAIFELAKKSQKDGEMTEDELKQAENKIQELTDKAIEQIDKILQSKETEILSI